MNPNLVILDEAVTMSDEEIASFHARLKELDEAGESTPTVTLPQANRLRWRTWQRTIRTARKAQGQAAGVTKAQTKNRAKTKAAKKARKRNR